VAGQARVVTTLLRRALLLCRVRFGLRAREARAPRAVAPPKKRNAETMLVEDPLASACH